MTLPFDCNIIADNKTDFIIADNIGNGKIPVLIGSAENPLVSDYTFDIDTLCRNNANFRVELKQLIKSISADNKQQKPLAESLSLLQNFIEQKMPLCPKEKLGLRTACIFDNEPFSYLVANNLAMCSERAAFSQYVLQKSGIKSYYANSLVQIQNVTTKPEQHAYLFINDQNRILVYDPANPCRNNQPRILNTGMNSAIFADFVDAVNYNSEAENKSDKKRVGFRCIDEQSGKSFVYHSLCGKKGENITPKKLISALKIQAPDTTYTQH